MAVDDESRSPLLGASDRRRNSAGSIDPEESTPLLSRSSRTPRYDGEEDDVQDRLPSPAATSLQSLQDGRPSSSSEKGATRWPTIAAIATLGTAALLIIAGAFVAPTVVEEYAKQAMVIEPTSLSIEKFTATGVQARIQANFRLDASRVEKDAVRNIGRAGTWIAREIESKEATVNVYLPEYGNILIGTATVPRVVVNIRNGHTTKVDFLADLVPGEVEGIKSIANDWLQGKLATLKVQGMTDVELKSGIFPLGTQSISESLVFEGHDIPAMPQYNITQMSFHEVYLPSGGRGMAADVSLTLVNGYPVKLSIPPLGFDILLPNCKADEPYISLADAITSSINVEPKADVTVEVGGLVRQLGDALLKPCPKSRLSPLDTVLGDYIHGHNTTLYVRGSNAPNIETPEWIQNIISSITVPVEFPGHTFDGAIKNFTLADVDFELPDPFADPGTPESNPRVSGDIEVLAAIPNEMNFGMNVSRVRAKADVFYKGKQLGVLDLKKWQPARSMRVNATESESAALKIESKIKDAPLNVTDEDVFSDLIQALLFGGETITLVVKALVDVEVGTVLGSLVVRDLPGEGNVPVKAPTGGGIEGLNLKVGDLEIIDTGKTSLELQAKVNFTNPTPYTAQVPFFNIHILNNGSIVGQATAKDVVVVKGNNTNLVINAIWDPIKFGGPRGAVIGRDLLSQYISGWNTTLTFRTHEGTIPAQPALGRALSKFNVTIKTPRLAGPPTEGDGDDDGRDDDDGSGRQRPRFIKDATFHLFSSTATFTLISPLQHSTMFIDKINATAFYNHTEPIGKIIYEYPFQVPPGLSTTPKLPVDWSLDSVGYEKARKALGGELKLDAEAIVKVRLGKWSEEVWYVGGGIGASVRL